MKARRVHIEKTSLQYDVGMPSVKMRVMAELVQESKYLGATIFASEFAIVVWYIFIIDDFEEGDSVYVYNFHHIINVSHEKKKRNM